MDKQYVGINNEAPQGEEYKFLNNAILRVNPAIQRRLDPVRVGQIAANYSPLVANPIKVSYRDGQYYIFDGLHTRTAEVCVHKTDDFPIFCRIFHGLTEEDEARLFSLQTGYSQPVSMIYRIRALKVAKDPEVLDFLDETEASGFSILLGNICSRNGFISAVCEAFKAYRALGKKDYGRMLRMIHKTWTGENWSVSKYMISGMARFLQMYEVSIPSFVKAFRHVENEDIRREVASFPGMSKEGAFAAAIANIYDMNCPLALQERAN